MVFKTARRREGRIFNLIENSQGPGASEGAQVAPRSVSRGSEVGSACIRFATHLLEAPKSVAVKLGPKIDPKNDQKMVPRWDQHLVKNLFKIGFRNGVHIGPVLGPSWDRLGTVFGSFFEQKV